MRYQNLGASDLSVSVVGLGCNNFGGRIDMPATRLVVDAAIDAGITLFDTAEFYGGGGGSETFLGELLAGRRDKVVLATKFGYGPYEMPYPQTLGGKGSRSYIRYAVEQSLTRLRTDRIDLYLLHWRGSIPLTETLAGFERLLREGKIRHYGVSNFDRADMAEWVALKGGDTVAADQVLYNLSRRGPEWDLVPWCRERGIAIMAYTPLGQGSLLHDRTLAEIAHRRNATPAQVALAWLLRQEGVIVIPKAARLEHVRDNRGALDVALTEEDLAALDRAFPPPKGKRSLGML